MRALAVVVGFGLVGCGRIGFDAQVDADPGELIANGDFAAGLQGWQVVRVSNGTVGEPYPQVLIWVSPLCGDACLLIDAPNESDAYVEQLVTVPAGRPLRWSLVSWGGDDPITVTLSYVNRDGVETILDSYDPPCKEDHGCVTPETRTYAISNYPGTQLTVRMRNTAQLGNRTRAFFDNVSLRVQ